MNPEDEVRHGRRSPYRFTMVPQWALLKTDLSDAGYRVYSLLLAHVNTAQADGKVWPHQKTLADMLGRRREAVGRVIREELEPGGLVTVKEDRYGTNDSRRRNIYFVHEEPPEGENVYASLSDWRDRNGKSADQSGGAENRSSGGAVNDSSASAENRSSGRAENRAGNYIHEERDQGGTTHTLGADAPGESAQGWSAEELDKRVAELCGRLADMVKANGAKRPKITYAWRDAARELLSGEDPYTFHQVWEGIRWAQADSFWASRTTTMAKLAKHFDQIIIQARMRSRDTSTAEGKQAQNDVVGRRMAAMSKFMAAFEEKYGHPMSEAQEKELLARLKTEIQ